MRSLWPSRGRRRKRSPAEWIEAIKPLLLQQPYITDVQFWTGQAVDYNLIQFRLHLNYNNLSDAHLSAFGLPFTERDTPWLTVAEPIAFPDRPLIINRSLRYQGNHAF